MSPKPHDVLMDHFMNPRNVGEMADADGLGEVANPICGDIVRLFLKIKSDKIDKAMFMTRGCRASIATSSILTEMLKDRPISEALKIKEKDMLSKLGDLPPLKRHCGKLAELALQAALGDHFARSKSDRSLLDTVAKRVRDRREWVSVEVEESGDESSTPL